MLSLNVEVIEPSELYFCSSLVIVPKKDGTNRFCIDFRLFKKQAIFDSEPILNPKEMCANLAGHKCFSKVELSKGYRQIKLTGLLKQKQFSEQVKCYFNSG